MKNIMKKFASLFLALTFLALSALSLSACETAPADVPEEMKKISADSTGYSFFVPTVWIGDVASGATTAYYSTTDASNVSVMTFSAEYADFTVDNWWDNFKGDFEKVYSDFEEVSSENTTLDGMAAMKFVYKGTLEDRTYQFMQVVTVRSVALSKPQIYVFTYTSLPETFDSHLEDVQMMLDNFKFN